MYYLKILWCYVKMYDKMSMKEVTQPELTWSSSFTRERRKWNLNLSDLCDKTLAFHVTHNSFLLAIVLLLVGEKYETITDKDRQLRLRGSKRKKKEGKYKRTEITLVTDELWKLKHFLALSFLLHAVSYFFLSSSAFTRCQSLFRYEPVSEGFS